MEEEIENLYVMSGGGAIFAYQFNVLCGLADAGLKPAMLGSTSTGTIGSFMFSKGLINEAHALCDEVYSTNARAITKPGLAEIKDGKIKINWAKALWNVTFKKNKIISLMDNSPLIETLTKLDNLRPGFPIEIFYNLVDMITGKLIERSTRDIAANQADRIKSMVASTTIPGVWPLIQQRYADAGLRDGAPLSAMFSRIKPGKKYRIIVISCNKQQLLDYEDLTRIDKILGRTGSIVLNENLVNDLGRTQDRNEVAKAIEEHRHELPQAFLDKLPYLHAPIYIIEYKGPSSTFSFTPESLAEQRETAKKDVALFIEKLPFV